MLKETNDMLYIIDHHNGFTTAVHTKRLDVNELTIIIQGLRFYQNVYINYDSNKDLFDDEGCPSWSNQDCQIVYQSPVTDDWFMYEDGSTPQFVKLKDEPNLNRNEDGWHWHDIV